MRRVGVLPALVAVNLVAMSLALVCAFLPPRELLVWAFVVVYAAVVLHNRRQLGRLVR